MLFLLVVLSELVGAFALKATLSDQDQIKNRRNMNKKAFETSYCKGREVACRMIKRFCEKVLANCVNAETGSKKH